MRCRRIVLAAALALGCDCGAATKPEREGGVGPDASPDAGSDATQCAGDCPGSDVDRDGQPAPPCGADCDDADPGVRPGQPDEAGDGRDTDCDGADGVDLDGDGYLSALAGGDDCDDSLAVVHPGAPDGEGWFVEALEAGPRTQLALDPWDRPVVAYTGWSSELHCSDDESDPTDGTSTVEVSRLTRGSWSSERVELTCTQGGIGLAVAPNSALSVAYTALARETGSRLRVAALDGGSGWHVETVDQSKADVALLVDRCGNPTVGYTWTQWEDHSLDSGRIARFTGAWEIETVQEGSGADGIDLARNDGERIDASYWLGSGTGAAATVAHAQWHSPGWFVDRVYDAGCYDCLWDTSVASSSTGDPVIAVLGQAGLRVLRRTGEDWSDTEIDPGPTNSWVITYERPPTVSLELDSAGTAHLAYATADAVLYATDRGGSWNTEQVGPAFRWIDYGGWPSLALDRLGGVHIAWYVQEEEVGSDLPPRSGRYAVFARPGDGVDQNCDGVDGVDDDLDGHASRDTGGDDADDADPAVK